MKTCSFSSRRHRHGRRWVGQASQRLGLGESRVASARPATSRPSGDAAIEIGIVRRYTTPMPPAPRRSRTRKRLRPPRAQRRCRTSASRCRHGPAAGRSGQGGVRLPICTINASSDAAALASIAPRPDGLRAQVAIGWIVRVHSAAYLVFARYHATSAGGVTRRRAGNSTVRHGRLDRNGRWSHLRVDSFASPPSWTVRNEVGWSRRSRGCSTWKKEDAATVALRQMGPRPADTFARDSAISTTPMTRSVVSPRACGAASTLSRECSGAELGLSRRVARGAARVARFRIVAVGDACSRRGLARRDADPTLTPWNATSALRIASSGYAASLHPTSRPLIILRFDRGLFVGEVARRARSDGGPESTSSPCASASSG